MTLHRRFAPFCCCTTTSAAAWCARATHHPGDPRAFPHLCAPCPRLKHAPACLHADLVVAHTMQPAHEDTGWLPACVLSAPRSAPECILSASSTHTVQAAGAAPLCALVPRLGCHVRPSLPMDCLSRASSSWPRVLRAARARGICTPEALHVTHGLAWPACAAIGSEMGEINALFERIGRLGAGRQLTLICIGQQSLLHSTGSDPAPTVAHVLPLDSSGAPLASTPRAPNTNHCPRPSTSGRQLRACSRPHVSPRRKRARHAAQTPCSHRGYHRDEVRALARAQQARRHAAARQKWP